MTRSATRLMTAALVLGVVSLFALGYAVAELAGGFRDIPRHWWSALPVIGLLAALGLAAFSLARR